MVRVKRRFAGPALTDVAGAVRQALEAVALPIRAGQTVALTAGSRGVVKIDSIVRATVAHCRARGARPFNALTACSPGGGKRPVVLDTAREAVTVALACLGLDRVEEARVVRIPHTLRLGEVEVSEALLPELDHRDDLALLGEPAPLAFAPDGSLPLF
jgi:hypothetical protein